MATNPRNTADKVVGPVTKANTDLAGGICRAIVVGSAGTLNFMDASGNVLTGYPAHIGENAIKAKQIMTGGTATDIWLLY